MRAYHHGASMHWLSANMCTDRHRSASAACWPGCSLSEVPHHGRKAGVRGDFRQEVSQHLVFLLGRLVRGKQLPLVNACKASSEASGTRTSKHRQLCSAQPLCNQRARPGRGRTPCAASRAARPSDPTSTCPPASASIPPAHPLSPPPLSALGGSQTAWR
eukprot:2130225-Rhodomonas_salina.1